ncbi:DUF3596 domain-containing protein [Alkalimonas collagenimarina]|uniref:DUF3596 domain-containing protein n=1 Tax=Alkalimonas collagenimarina TaxID=400390 RepID=A0ABT9GX32_9GAMM|nr:DUF3596 domain-containing protein [Alkalimonas collagenimarina]MDP4535588.1 DUF3596 domain-containing protein [Alkalimonas collagenimarina]
MGRVYARKETNKLFMDFNYRGKRCREQTELKDTPANRKKVKAFLERVEAEITLGTFEYGRHFPDSPRAEKFKSQQLHGRQLETPLFSGFSQTWFSEMQIQWRPSHQEKVQSTLRMHLLPHFGEKEVGCISKADILKFRASLAKVITRSNKPLSSSRINHIMTPLRMILHEAANRFNFSSPYEGIKSLKVPRSDVEPFSIDEVRLILQSVRPDFKSYYTVRFFTGMRTAEVDGLQWDAVDFNRRQVIVKRALVRGIIQETKNDSSYRAIDMNDLTMEALQAQQNVTGDQPFVFCSSAGTPLSHNNVTKRVWYPLLRFLELPKRRPYQTRHTAATLWLAAGESPEWIARQMGHSTTEMLFRVYSRYVPNLTRQDGSAFARLLNAEFSNV